MKNYTTLRCYFVTTLFLALVLQARTQVPRPDHVVVLILENHGYSQIIGSADAPYINALATDNKSALFTQSYAVTHPSQPNYIDLYSGCNQGVLLDFLPSGTPWTTDNLGRQLLDSGFTWATYSEDLPAVGSDVETNLAYVRRHNPAANWMGTGQNQIPPTTNQPFTAFPSDFDSLPTVCFVIPNLDHDMHDGSVSVGDTWYHDYIDPYVQWAKTHNSLLILTYDEDDGIIFSSNHILTIFAGEPVAPGSYSEAFNHYTVLRTIEDMYGLPYACNAAAMLTITDCWLSTAVQPNFAQDHPQVSVFPSPSTGKLTVNFVDYQHSQVEVVDLNGKVLSSLLLTGPKTDLVVEDLASGLYFVRVSHRKGVAVTKFVRK